MSNFYYVISCVFREEDCDEYGSDCYLCPFYREEDEDDEEYDY